MKYNAFHINYSLPSQLIVASYNFTPKDEKKNPYNLYADFCAPPNKRSVEAKNVPKEKFFELSTEMLKSLLKEFGVRHASSFCSCSCFCFCFLLSLFSTFTVFYFHCFLLPLCHRHKKVKNCIR